MSEENDRKERCDKCRFFVGRESDPIGECHRYPPKADGESMYPGFFGEFHWCGEFQPSTPKGES